jgi:two-component system, OmpR family, alkaline phosphatase synthesis response regulator PhoP
VSRVLVIEDNTDLAAGLRYNLELEGYEVRVAEDGNAGVDVSRAWGPDLVILDLMLPGLDGYQVLQALRGEGRQMPILILSAKGEEADKVRGFRLDADQYVTKPFGLLELLERVRSLLRRAHARGPTEERRPALAFGRVEVDPSSRTVTVRGETVTLTPKAYDLMMALVRRNGAVATRVELLREVWDHRALVLTRTVDSHMAELRRKLEEDPAEPRHFLTVWKVGYRFRS